MDLLAIHIHPVDPETIEQIREKAPACDMRIVTAEDYIPLPASFVAECGRLGIGICIMNTARFAKGDRSDLRPDSQSEQTEV